MAYCRDVEFRNDAVREQTHSSDRSSLKHDDRCSLPYMVPRRAVSCRETAPKSDIGVG